MDNNTVEENLAEWNERHEWAQDGDEWNRQAELCGVPYETWKQSLIDTLIVPNVTGKSVLEVAPGHGRWTEHIAKSASRVVIVDLSPNCIEFCRQRFADATNVEYHVNDGTSLPAELTSEIDFVWSYDAFVHMNADVIGSYFTEFARILKPGGTAIVHHANRRYLPLAFMRRLGRVGRKLYTSLEGGDGMRSNVSAEIVATLAQQAGLGVDDQFQYWGDKSCGVPRFNDLITALRKPL